MVGMYRGMYKVKGRSKRALKRSLKRLPKMSTKRSRATTPISMYPPLRFMKHTYLRRIFGYFPRWRANFSYSLPRTPDAAR